MDWQTLFLSAEGRIGRKDFWIGVLILFAVWAIAPVVHILAPLIWLLLVYPWVCVFAKRLHDFGKSAWLIALPFAVGAVCLSLGVMFGGLAALGSVWSLAYGAENPSAWAMMISGFGIMFAFVCLAGLVKLAFLLWVGLSPGDPAANRYGPAPVLDVVRPPTPQS